MLKESLIDGVGVGIGVPLVYKAQVIASDNFKKHGTYFKIDGDIIKGALKKDGLFTIKMAVIAAVVYAGTSWVARVTQREVPSNTPEVAAQR
jgi:hypothetical protein